MLCKLPSGFICILGLILSLVLLEGCGLAKSMAGFQERQAPQPLPEAPPLPPKPKPMVTQEKKLTVKINASKKLNLYLANPHALLLTIFQLDTTQNFKKLARTSAGLRKLMTGSGLDNSIVARTHKYLQPGANFTITLDREEGAKYIAVVAGYYQLNPRHVVRLAPLPESVCVRPYANDEFDNVVGGEVKVIAEMGELKVNRFGISDTRECLDEYEVESLGFQQPNINRGSFNNYSRPTPSYSNPRQQRPGGARRTIDNLNKGVEGAYDIFRKKQMIEQMSMEIDAIF